MKRKRVTQKLLMLSTLLLAGILLLLSINQQTHAAGSAQGANAAPNVIPRLREWTGGTGNFTLSNNSRIVIQATSSQSYTVGITSPTLVTRTLTTVANDLKDDIQTVTGLNLSVVSGVSVQNGDIFVQLDSADTGIGTEGYNLEIGDRIILKANTSTGVFYGGRTLLQTLKQDDNQRDIPKGTARDYPAQQVRLIMLDMGRKYWDKGYLKDVMRQMSWHKLNVFNMHFAEAEGFRLNSPAKFPGLADLNSSYSQADIQELEAFAKEHHISIMPGFEFPGHATLIADHFNIGFGDGSNPCTNAHTHSHLTPNFVIDMTSTPAVNKVNEILNEFLPWFSGPYVHVGGDEVPDALGNCPRVTSYISANSDVGSLGDVLIKFINGMNTTIKANNKQTVIFGGWDHLSSPQQNPASDIIMMDWQGSGGGFAGYKKIVVGPVGDIFLTPNNYHSLYTDEAKLYDNWTASSNSEVLGTGLTVWADYNFWAPEKYFEDLFVRPRSILADRTWNSSTTSGGVNGFYTRITQVGNPPGYVGFTTPSRVNDGQPSHHYTFEPANYPSGYHYASRPPQTILLTDTLGTLPGASYIINNPAVTNDGKVGSAFTFNSNADGVGIGGVDIAPPWTVAVWTKRTGNLARSTLLYSKDKAAIRMEQWNNSHKVGITKIGVADYTFNYSTPLNQWVHLTLVGTASDTKLYVNGALNGTIAQSISLPMMSIGESAGTMRGSLDEMKIYDEGLSAAQVLSLYNSYGSSPTPTPTPTPQPATLVHHWTFDEGSGSAAADSVSGGNNGALIGATWVAGKHGSNALSFDGNGDYVQIGGSAISNNWSAAMWVKRKADTTTAALLSAANTSSGNAALKLEQWNNTHRVGLTKFGQGDYNFGYTSPLNTWVHLTFVGSSSETRLYVNGALHNTRISQGITLPVYRIGAYSSGSESINAELDDVKIYNGQLSAAEVQTLYNSYTSNPTPTNTPPPPTPTPTNTPPPPTPTPTNTPPPPTPTNTPSPPTPTNTPPIPAPTPVSHWQFNSNANDAVGSNNGTVAGGASYDTSDKKEGSASLTFDGSDDRVTLGNPSNLQIQGQISIAAWVKADGAGGIRNIVAKGHTTSPNGEIFLRLNGANYQAGSWNGSDHKVSVSGADSDVGNWVYLVGVYDGAQWILYKNGVSAGTATDSTGAVAVSADWAIGSRGGTAERFFDGKIDDVRIYNTALTAAQVQALFNSF